MEQWEKNYYISSIAGATNGSSLVVMSKGLFALFPFSCHITDKILLFAWGNVIYFYSR